MLLRGVLYKETVMQSWLFGASIVIGAMMFCALPVTAAEGKPLPAALEGVHRLAFFGDSLTDGSDFPEYIVNTLNRLYPEQKFDFINAGICGNRAKDLVNRLDRDILSQKPGLTFIFIGTNDHADVAPIQFKAELMYLSRRLKAAGSKVAFISLSGNTDPEKAAKLRVFSEISREVAAAEKDLFIDAWSFFEKEQKSGKEMYNAPADSHHSLEGFRGMARVILTALGVPADAEMVLTVAPPANLLTAWEESGPVTVEKGKTLEPSLVTEWTKYDPAQWVDKRDWALKPLTQRGAWFPLQADGKGKSAFARTTYDAPKDGLYELQLGGSGVVVWVNGTKIYTMGDFFKSATNGYHPNAVRTPVLLKKGKNEIVITCGFYAFVGVKPLD